MGKFEEAIKDFDKAIELNPQDAEVYIERGFMKFLLTKYEEAFEDYKKAGELDPQNRDENEGLRLLGLLILEGLKEENQR